MTTTANALDVAELTRAIVERDADAVTGLYADDAELTIVDRNSPPSSPTVYRGRAEIHGFYADVCGRNMDHEVADAIQADGRLAFVERCVYPDGTRVLCSANAELRDGRIVRQTAVQAWDG